MSLHNSPWKRTLKFSKRTHLNNHEETLKTYLVDWQECTQKMALAWTQNTRNCCATDVDLDRGALPQVKTLGVLWSPKHDTFKYPINANTGQFKNTKRDFLKKITTLFDPLGFLQPFTIKAKVLFQEMWRCGVDWDKKLPIDLPNKAQQWINDMTNLLNLNVSPCLMQNKVIISTTLHTFVDASQEAHGVVVYVRPVYKDNTVTCRLVA